MTGHFRKLFSVTQNQESGAQVEGRPRAPGHLMGQNPCPGLLPLSGRIGFLTPALSALQEQH